MMYILIKEQADCTVYIPPLFLVVPDDGTSIPPSLCKHSCHQLQEFQGHLWRALRAQDFLRPTGSAGDGRNKNAILSDLDNYGLPPRKKMIK
jgi:hypothetical protein